MNTIASNLARVEERIAAACRASGRERSDVTLVAVSKNFSVEAVREAVSLGLTHFGENRLQEAEPKILALASPGVRWHFIGQMQSNKLNRILERFGVVESFDRVELLEKAEEFLAAKGWERGALLEVDISGEETKAGFDPDELEALLESVDWSEFTRLKVRGLMGIAPHTPDRARIRASFDRLKALFDRARGLGLAWDTLSMGMSSDLEEAIAAGSTQIRIGTALFGSRSS